MKSFFWQHSTRQKAAAVHFLMKTLEILLDLWPRFQNPEFNIIYNIWQKSLYLWGLNYWLYIESLVYHVPIHIEGCSFLKYLYTCWNLYVAKWTIHSSLQVLVNEKFLKNMILSPPWFTHGVLGWSVSAFHLICTVSKTKKFSFGLIRPENFHCVFIFTSVMWLFEPPGCVFLFFFAKTYSDCSVLTPKSRSVTCPVIPRMLFPILWQGQFNSTQFILLCKLCSILVD